MKEKGIQTKIIEEKKEMKEKEIQTKTVCNKGVENNQRRLEEKIDHILKRMDDLEKRFTVIKEKSDKDPAQGKEQPWSKIIGRKKVQGKEKEVRRETQVQETVQEISRQRSKSRTRSLKNIQKRFPKGAGVIIEVQRGINKDYDEIIRECQKNIPLEEIGIPSTNMRKTRSGGILLEVRGEREEEKAVSV